MSYFYKLKKPYGNTGYNSAITYIGAPYSYKVLGEEFSIYNQNNLAKAKITLYHNNSGGSITAIELTNNINSSNVRIKSGTSNDEYAYLYGFPKIFCSTLNYVTSDEIENLPKTTISGRYKFRARLTWGEQALILQGATIPVQVSINGEVYKNLILSRYNTWKHGYEASNASSPVYLSAYSEVNDPKTTPVDFKNDFISSTGSGYGDLSNDYINMIWDFGVTAQEVPTAFKTWVEYNADYIYPNTYTVKNASGDTILGSINASPIQSVRLSVLGNTKTFILTGTQNFTIEWESETPENLIFLGLTTEPNSNRVVIPTNIDINVSWAGDIILYECYGKYRPPQTTFDIVLYKNRAENNRVDKRNFLTPLNTLIGALRDECSIINPSIVYQSSDVPTFNYVYIPIFNRYYFVTHLSSISKNIWRMELKCDVLMSYKEQIYALQAVIGRQENDFNPLLVDNELPTQNNPIVEVIDIPSNAFNTQTSDEKHNFLLTVIGA